MRNDSAAWRCRFAFVIIAVRYTSMLLPLSQNPSTNGGDASRVGAFLAASSRGKMQCSYTKLLLSCESLTHTFNAFALSGRDCSNTGGPRVSLRLPWAECFTGLSARTDHVSNPQTP